MFSKAKTEVQQAPAKSAKRGGAFSVIGADVSIVGDLVTTDNLQVNGRIAGDVRCGTLHQGASGAISGNVIADEARLAGIVEGTVTARILVLEPNARISGDVSYESLSIECGARVTGRFTHDAGVGQEAGSVTHLFPPGEAVEAAE